MKQFAADGILKSLDGVLGGAISRLQRYPSIGERRSDEDDRAVVTRKHVPQSCPRPVNLSEIGDIGHAAIFLMLDVDEPREDPGKGIVDPYVRHAPHFCDAVGRSIHLIEIGDVRRQDHGQSAQLLHISGRRFQAVMTAGEKRNGGAPSGEFAGGRASDSC